MKLLILKKQFSIIILALGVFVVLGYFLFTQSHDKELVQTDLALQKMIEEPEEPVGENKLEETKPSQLFVDVKGEVVRAGVYQVNQGERVYDVIEKAGGFTKFADQNKVNLAQILQDEMVLYIPKVGEESEMVSLSHPNSQSESKKMNINVATTEELETLPGIGPSKAAAIVKFRDEQGRFQTIKDLMNVAGIGESTFSNIKEHIDVH